MRLEKLFWSPYNFCRLNFSAFLHLFLFFLKKERLLLGSRYGRGIVSDEYCDRLQKLYVLADDFNDNHQRNRKDHSYKSPHPSPQGQRDENEEGGYPQVFAFPARLNEIAERHVYRKDRHADINHMAPAWIELQHGEHRGRQP